jgi:hypothetical protein
MPGCRKAVNDGSAAGSPNWLDGGGRIAPLRFHPVNLRAKHDARIWPQCGATEVPAIGNSMLKFLSGAGI